MKSATPRPFSAFLTTGTVKRFGAGILFAAALASVGVPAHAGPSSAPAATAGETSGQFDGDVRNLVRAIKARPGDVMTRICEGLSHPDRDRSERFRLMVQAAGQILAAEAKAAGPEAVEDLSDLLEKAARGAATNGRPLMNTMDAMTMLDPKGDVVHPFVRDTLWRELAARARPRSEKPAFEPSFRTDARASVGA